MDFQNEVPILFKKYKVKKKIGQGAFGSVYLGKSISDNKSVAIKVEKKNVQRPSLEAEAYLLVALKGFGVPEMLSFGNAKSYRALVEPLLGQNLFNIFIQNGMQFSLEDICLISIQVIERIQFVHSHFIIHRDIKPDNFLIGKEDPNVIYLVDFGLSKKYRSSTTKKHVPFRITGKLTGTLRFSSANALRGGEQSRKDDLISIGYMIIFFMRRKLPWQQFNRVKNDIEKYIKIYKMKKEIKPEQLCQNLPQEMVMYMRYVQKLGFEQNPDYKYLKDLFKSILKKKNENYDKLLFSWIKASDFKKLKKVVNPSSRRSSSRERLWKKINENIQKRGTSSESSEHHSFDVAQKVKANAPNIKMIRNNSKDTFDISMVSSENNSRALNTNTLMVNLEKTINNQLITSLKVIDIQNESKDSKATQNGIISFEKDKINENKKINNFNNFNEKESGSMDLGKLSDNKSDAKINDEIIKQKERSKEESYKEKMQYRENIQQDKNIILEDQTRKLKEEFFLKNKGKNKLSNDFNLKEGLNKDKIKEKMMKMKKNNLIKVQNEGNNSNKNVLINNDIKNMVNKLYKKDNNDNDNNNENLKGVDYENKKSDEIIFNNKNEDITKKNNLYKENNKMMMNNLINKKNLKLKNINNNREKLINKNKINNINDKDNYINTENGKNIINNINNKDNYINTENSKTQNHFKKQNKMSKNITYNRLYNPNTIAFTEPSDTVLEFDDNAYINQTDKKNINFRKKNFYKASNDTFNNLNNFNNLGMNLNNQFENIGINNFPDDSALNEKLNQKKKNILKNQNNIKNNMNQQKINNNNLMRFNNFEEINKYEISMKDNIFQVNDFDKERINNNNFKTNKIQAKIQQKNNKKKNYHQNNNNHNNNYNNQNNNYNNQNNNYNELNNNYNELNNNYNELNNNYNNANNNYNHQNNNYNIQKNNYKQINYTQNYNPNLGQYPNYNNMEPRNKMEKPTDNIGNLDDMDLNFFDDL